MYAFINKTKELLGFKQMQVVRADVFKFMEGANKQYDFIFAGPPYALTTIDQLPEMVFKKNLLRPKGWFILEHTPRNDYRKHPHFRAERKYGTTIFSIFIQE
jgi:16S rRNA G966 N2-methylase RsmD